MRDRLLTIVWLLTGVIWVGVANAALVGCYLEGPDAGLVRED